MIVKDTEPKEMKKECLELIRFVLHFHKQTAFFTVSGVLGRFMLSRTCKNTKKNPNRNNYRTKRKKAQISSFRFLFEMSTQLLFFYNNEQRNNNLHKNLKQTTKIKNV